MRYKSSTYQGCRLGDVGDERVEDEMERRGLEEGD